MASDKARFYLEQQVPELQEYERKQIFTREEIAAIAKKRSDFEHILNARGSKAADYVRYATYEMNLDSLRKKRCKRLGVKATAHGGQRTIFFILDRATKKFPGDLGLWVQYVQFCQKEKASKKLAKVFTSMLRLKPREWGLWVLAAKHYAEEVGDMTTARSYMQRGLRFCKDERRMYLEYAKLEMVYLAKLAARRKILGLDEERKAPEGPDEEDDNMMMLPEISAEDLDPEANKGVEEVNAAALERLANAPAYTGAIPLAIFDAAMKQFSEDSDVANDFFDLVADGALFDGRGLGLEEDLEVVAVVEGAVGDGVAADGDLVVAGVEFDEVAAVHLALVEDRVVGAVDDVDAAVGGGLELGRRGAGGHERSVRRDGGVDGAATGGRDGQTKDAGGENLSQLGHKSPRVEGQF